MAETTSDIRSPAKREKLRRMALWALLGAASGAGAWIVVWAVDGSAKFLFFAPGITFGLVIGLALFGLGYARLWQAALFAVLSVPAWYAGFYVGNDWASGLYSEYLSYFVIGVVGGTAWAIVQTLAVAPLSFARRVRPLVTLVLVGAVTAGLLLVAGDVTVGFFDDMLFLILWTGWYAVYAAVLSVFLPWPKSEAPPRLFRRNGNAKEFNFPAVRWAAFWSVPG